MNHDEGVSPTLYPIIDSGIIKLAFHLMVFLFILQSLVFLNYQKASYELPGRLFGVGSKK